MVNDIAASEGGALSVLKDFYKEIEEIDNNIEWIFLLGDNYLKKTSKIKIFTYPEIKKSWMKRLKFELFDGSTLINNLKPDIYISLQNTATLGIKHAKQFVYFHQVIPYQDILHFKFYKKDEVKLWIYKNIGKLVYSFLFRKSEAYIIVQSNWLKSRMSLSLNNKIIVAKPRIDEIIKKQPIIGKSINFFYPTSDFKYKNLKVITEAIEILEKQNINNFKVILTLDNNSQNKFNSKIDLVGKITRQEVYDYLSKSILIFPSLLESFGLPLLEASQLGTLIFSADLEYARETLQNYSNVKFFPPEDAVFLAKLMKDAITGKIVSKECKKVELKKTSKKIIELILEEYHA
ncbi:glycosyltransferase [Enterococcus sp.]|uniref:glycosyltransferase n=1 Tax=Enterococcus sp. TaxID=35783 RepID=UPI003C7184D2